MPAKIRRALTSLNWITTEELAARWGLSPRHIALLAARGRIPGKKIGAMWIIPADVERPAPMKKGRRMKDDIRLCPRQHPRPE